MLSRFRFGGARIVVVVLPALLAVGCLSAFQRTLPVAMGNHTNSLATSEAGLRVSAPTTRSGLWNAVGRTLVQNYGHVVEEDAEAGAMISDFSYTTPQSSDSTVAVQERTRMAVVVPLGTTDASRIRVTFSSERRERRVGGEPSAWTPAGPSDAAAVEAFRAQVVEAASGARTVPLESISWSAPPQEAARLVARHLTRYTVSDGTDPTRLETEWRISAEAMDDDQLVVRSRLRFLFDEADAGASRVSVFGELQYRIEQGARAPEARTQSAWSDANADRVVSHGWATVRAAVTPVVEAARDEPLEAFASAAAPTPELADPRASWGGAAGTLPVGVARTTGGGSVEVAWLGQETALDLIGRAFTADLQPAGRVDLLGEPVAREIQEENVLTSVLRVGDSTELSAGFLVVSGHVGTTSERTVVVHAAFSDANRYEVPEFAGFSAVGPSARYYVASVTTGRAVAVSFLGTSNTMNVGGDVSYQGFRAGVEHSIRRRRVRCTVRGRGVSTSLSCDARHVPTSAEVVRARDQGRAEAPAVTRVVLRRIPASIRPLRTPQSITVTRFSVDGSMCADAFNDPPDLRLSWGVDGRSSQPHTCRSNSRSCNLALSLRPGTRRVVFSATDIDVAFDDRCGTRTSFNVSRWRAANVETLPPGPIVAEDHAGGFTVRYSLVY